MTAFLDFVAAWLIDYFAAATVVFAGALAVRLVLRQPAARMAVAWSACVGLALLAVLTALPAWPRVGIDALAWPMLAASEVQPPVEVAIEPPQYESVEASIAMAAPASQGELDMPATVPSAPVVANEPLDWAQLAAALWLGGFALAVGWVALGHWRAGRLVRAAVKAPAWAWDELRLIVERTTGNATSDAYSTAEWARGRGGAGERRLCRSVPPSRRLSVSLLASRRIHTAAALGAIFRKIILPESSLDQSNRPAVRAALAHEWAHVRHGDLWLLALERLLLPLLALHPLFWWLRKSVRLDQELLADAAAAGDEPAEYAEALLAWARTAQPARHGLAALSMWEHPSTLSRRVAMILDSKQRIGGRLSGWWTAAVVALAIPAVLGLSLVSLRPMAAQDKPPEAEAAEPSEAASRLPASASSAPRASWVPVTQVHLEMLMASVQPERLAAKDTSLHDIIAKSTGSRCRMKDGLVVSEISPEEVAKLLEVLKEHEALKEVTRPQIITLDGREANVRVGGELPILRVDETVNGKKEQRLEYRELGARLTVRPTLLGDKGDRVRLEIQAERSSPVPPDDAAAEGPEPRDVPSLALRRFETIQEAQLGHSVLIAHAPRHGDSKVTDETVVVITPQRAVRTLSAVYSDPRSGEQAEAEKQKGATAQEAATAAEPEPGTGAAALLARERDARARETAELKRQVDELSKEIAKLREATGHKLVSREIQLQNQDPRVVAEALSLIIANSPNKHHFAVEKITAGPGRNSIVIQIEEKNARDFEHAIEALDRPLDGKTPENPYTAAVRKVLEAQARAGAEKERAAQSAGHDAGPPPPPRKVPAQQPGYPHNWGELTADVAEARLELERAEKANARVEQLKARGAISEAQVDEMRFNLEKAKIQLQRAESRLHAPALANTAPAIAADNAKVSNRTEVRLLELDLAEAKLAVEEAEARLAHVQQIKERNPGALSDQEFRTYTVAAERAKIQMQRVMIRLEAAKEGETPRGR